jgi:nitrite reductase (NADH) large subunit
MQASHDNSNPDTSGETLPSSDLPNRAQPVVVIGMGPVGVRMVRELRRLSPDCSIEWFGDAPLEPLVGNQPILNLVDELNRTEIEDADDLLRTPDIQVHANQAVVGIDRAGRSVTTRHGNRYGYRHLVLATGSQPRMPAIPGIDLAGVFTFRDITESHRLFARRSRSRHVLVIGGGLVGLECARALRRFNTRVTVIERNARLMFQQLDKRGSDLLLRHLKNLGVRVITQASVREILGAYGVQGVELGSGEFVRCDRVVLATGILPNIDLAREAGLKTRRGILVNDRLQTSDPRIFAVGECVEHRGRIHGLIAPGYEQAAVAASVIAGRKASYTGPRSLSSLHVAGLSITSLGEVQEGDWRRDDPIYLNEQEGIYRKLVMDGDRLIGVMALGEWREVVRLRDLQQQGGRINLWQLRRFRRCGHLFRPVEQNHALMRWPESTHICPCADVSLGELVAVLAAGARDLSQLSEATRAGDFCGNCKALVADLIDGYRQRPSVIRRRTLVLVSSLLGLGLTLYLVLDLTSYHFDSIEYRALIDRGPDSGVPADR